MIKINYYGSFKLLKNEQKDTYKNIESQETETNEQM